MRILVVSDSHGNKKKLRKVIMAQPKAELVIHLGDGEEDLNSVKPDFPQKMFLQVQGNCDFGSKLPVMEEFTIDGYKIFYTHGHHYNVKFGDFQLVEAARSRKADIVLYGHTHIKASYYDNGLYVINPGALTGYAKSYATIDIEKGAIVPNIIDVK